MLCVVEYRSSQPITWIHSGYPGVRYNITRLYLSAGNWYLAYFRPGYSTLRLYSIGDNSMYLEVYMVHPTGSHVTDLLAIKHNVLKYCQGYFGVKQSNPYKYIRLILFQMLIATLNLNFIWYKDGSQQRFLFSDM